MRIAISRARGHFLVLPVAGWGCACGRTYWSILRHPLGRWAPSGFCGSARRVAMCNCECSRGKCLVMESPHASFATRQHAYAKPPAVDGVAVWCCSNHADDEGRPRKLHDPDSHSRHKFRRRSCGAELYMRRARGASGGVEPRAAVARTACLRTNAHDAVRRRPTGDGVCATAWVMGNMVR